MGGDREHVLEFGLPPELEEAMAYAEPTDRYEAIEGALAGLTACINGTVVYNAIREGIDVEEVTTTVRAPVDLRMLFGIHDVDRAHDMYGELEIDVNVPGYEFNPTRFADVNTPTLLLTGSESPEWGKESTEALDDALPNTRVHTFDGHGHAAMLTALDRFTDEVLAFIRGGS
ncbi:hypothetical protein [Natronococcus sp.]|uniref:hypothetical protein n=1 Tax=Natronococcus sp. TaxID=35747 RepID=UPI0025EAF390|nr:hypothetical protein [Natronococcus sp.]